MSNDNKEKYAKELEDIFRHPLETVVHSNEKLEKIKKDRKLLIDDIIKMNDLRGLEEILAKNQLNVGGNNAIMSLVSMFFFYTNLGLILYVPQEHRTNINVLVNSSLGATAGTVAIFTFYSAIKNYYKGFRNYFNSKQID